MSTSSHRLSTVYDYTSLRIHPDGSRVNQSSHNLRPRIARGAVRDSRGNWIARDAGGLATVKKYTSVRDEASDGESFDFGDVEVQKSNNGPGSQGNKRKGKAPHQRERNGRSAAKRQKFMNDFEFLATPQPVDGPPLPSSDLLKCIHYFASTYYNERGQLFNGSREFRQQRKINKLKRRQEMETQSASTSLRGTPDADTNQVEEEEPKKPRRGGRVKGAGRVIHRKDMYKVMDGSALVVLGMLLQEYVADMLEVRIPEGWEESVRNAYKQASGEGSDKDEDNTDDVDTKDHDNTDMEDDEDIHSAPSSMPPENCTEDEDNMDGDDDEDIDDGEDPEDDSE